MEDSKLPLTEQQIRELIVSQRRDLIQIGAELIALRQTLLQKGILTESEIVEVKKASNAEAKKAVARMEDAIRKGPAGGIQ